MPISAQMKMLNAIREIFLGDGQNAFPKSDSPKPDFPSGHGAFLPRSTPDKQGIPSKDIDNFYKGIANSPDAYAHSLLVLKNGKVISEGYFSPYRKGIWHVLHSLSKTFTGMAVGMAIDEGLFRLDSSAAAFFPEAVGRFPGKYIKDITVHHLLTMSSGISFNEISEALETDWLRGIFSSPVTFQPGTKFVYNSMNSYLLAAIVAKTAGTSLKEFLNSRLFEPMDFSPIGWECCPKGIEKGGWGMYAQIEDLAKFGQLYLQKGLWHRDGKNIQIVSENWIKQSTTVQIDSSENEGYGYQIWIDKTNGCIIMSGMFGQYVTIIPHQNMVVAMNAGNSHMFTDSDAYALIKKHFVDNSFVNYAIPASPKESSKLSSTLASLRYNRALPASPNAKGVASPPVLRQPWIKRPLYIPETKPAEVLGEIIDTIWKFEHNRGGILPVIVQAMNNNFTSGIKGLYLKESADFLKIYWEEGKGTICIYAGWDKPIERTINVGNESFIIASTANIRYNEDNKPVLILEICFLEHSSSRTLKLSMQDKKLLLRMDESPQFIHAIESAIEQGNSTGQSPLQQHLGLGGRLLGREVMNYSISQLCTPTLLGKQM